jgi:LuxR family transcriptional regulator, maltose regulon positive regulatory protein
MTASPLLAKITRPQVGAVLRRTTAWDALDTVRRNHAVIWIAAAPGAGKTTLVASYLEQRKSPCLWFQIDEGDSDPATFFHYLAAAAKAAAPRRRKPLPRLTPEHLPSLGVFARRFFQALYERLPHNTVLVFDNYQEAAPESPLHELLRHGLLELPPGNKAMVISRVEPPAALARLQLNNVMGLLDAGMLRLSLAEIPGLAKSLGYQRVTDEVIHRIADRTHGWAAGAVLLLAQAQHEPQTEQSTEAAPQVLFDYFAGEVFQHLDPTTQDILLQSTFLPKMSSASLLALTGQVRAPRVLAELAGKKYFTTVHTHSRNVYQYHPLFRAFLLAEAKRRIAQPRLGEIQRQAAQLLHAEGETQDAVHLLHAAGDWEALALIIVTQAPALAAEARLQTLETWIRMLPATLVDQMPWLLFWLAQCRMMVNPAEARDHSERAYALFDQAGDAAGLYLSWSSVVYTFAVGWQDLRPLDRWLELFTSIEARYPEIPSAEITARVTCSMLAALTHRQPRHPNTERWTQLATAMANSPGNGEYRVMLAAYLGIFYTWSGPFRRGGELITLVRPLLAGDLSPTIQILWRCFVGMYASARTADVECLAAAEEARRIARDSKANAMDNIIGIIGIHACLAVGDVRAAETWVTSTDALHDTGQIDYAVYYYGLSLIAMHKGEVQSAAEYARKSLTLAQQFGNALPEGVARVGLAQALFELGQPAQAREQLAMAWEVTQHIRSELLEYLCWFGQATDAICYAGETDWVAPLNALLAREKDNGGMGVPLWPQARVAQVYTFALDQGIEVEYVRSVIRRRNLMPQTPPLDVENWPWSYRIYTLGGFSIDQNDKPMTLSGKGQKKPLELLKTLIALGGREVGALQLTEALWPDADGDAAQHAFETTLHRLRKFFGDDAPLQFKDGRLSLDDRRCWIDGWAFERLLSNIEGKLGKASPDQVASLTKKLFDLYRGPFLSHEAEIPAALSMHERLRSRFLRALRELGRHHETCKAFETASACYLRALEVEPLAEEFYQKLMLGYRALGRIAEALAVYERCRKTLHALLGVGPSRETEALRASLVAEQG